MYFPVQPRAQRNVSAYLTLVRKLARWLDNLLDRLGSSTTPILFMDLNDGMGLVKHVHGWQLADDLACVAPIGARAERIVGGAGQEVRGGQLRVHWEGVLRQQVANSLEDVVPIHGAVQVGVQIHHEGRVLNHILANFVELA